MIKSIVKTLYSTFNFCILLTKIITKFIIFRDPMSKSFLIISTDEAFIEEKISDLLDKLNISQNSVDFLIIDQNSEESSIGIDVTRKLKKWLSVKPFNSENKLVVIKNANLLTIQAQNSILKQLEEPNPNHYIALVLENRQMLLPTVLSRCELIADLKHRQSYNNKNIIQLNRAEQFSLIEEILKIKDHILLNKNIKDLLRDSLIYLEQELIKDPYNKTIRDNIALVEQTTIMITANTSKRLALENLLINMKR